MISIIKNRRIWFVFSGLLIGASIVSLAFYGLRLGIDFTGGALLEGSFKGERPAGTQGSETLSGFGEAVVQPRGERGVIVRLPPLTDDAHREVLEKIRQNLGEADELRFESIGPVIGKELLDKAVKALAFVFVSIVIYIAWAFRKVSRPISSWTYGVITVITALHDVVAPLGLFSILGKVQNEEVGGAFVAAILTVMGYSINDTIVVLDRVRENLARTSGTFQEIVERSVRQSFARSINTTMTTLLALIAVYIFGGESVKNFSLALIVGIATGAYSSIFIAAPLLVVWNNRKRR